jgi:TPR repeat protein
MKYINYPIILFVIIGMMSCQSDPFNQSLKLVKRGDYKAAIVELSPMAEMGNQDAQVTLGYLYRDGLGVSQDFSEAMKWFQKAAEQGNAQAQFDLGMMYLDRQNAVRDDLQALMWLNFSVAAGHKEALVQRENLVVRLTPVQIAEVQRMARNFKPGAEYKRIMNELRQAEESGTAESQLKLGVMYYRGQGVEVNTVEAAEWFRKAAQKNNLYAQYNLGLFLEKGIGVAQDFKEAAFWFLQSAGLGYDKAQYKIGQFYEKGIGVQQDDVEAGKWYILAAMHGHDAAVIALKNLFNLLSEDKKNAAQRLAREFRVSVK